MSDLAERIRELVDEWRSYVTVESQDDKGACACDLAMVTINNAPTILAGLAAIDERDKLREALLYVRDVLFVLPSVITNDDDVDRRIGKGIAMIDAALQPTQEEPR